MAPHTFRYEKSEVFEELSEGENSIFETNIELLVFAACVGHAQNNRVNNPNETGEIRWSYVSQNQKLSVVVAALAYADTEDPEAILDPGVQITSLTSYGAGGARIIKNKVVDEPGENLDNLIDFLNQHRDANKLEEQVGILEQIENEISSL